MILRKYPQLTTLIGAILIIGALVLAIAFDSTSWSTAVHIIVDVVAIIMAIVGAVFTFRDYS